MFLNKQQDNWSNNKQYLKSTINLNLLPEQIIYVEGSYNNYINEIVGETYKEISCKLKSSGLSAEFIYLPIVAKQLQGAFSLSYILKYYFPNIKNENKYQVTSAISQTDFISHLLFGTLGYGNQINPGFFRYVEKDEENNFIYEYFSFEASNKFSLLRQIDYYIRSIAEIPDSNNQLPVKKEEDILFDDAFIDSQEQQEEPFPKDFFDKKVNKPKSNNTDTSSIGEVLKKGKFTSFSMIQYKRISEKEDFAEEHELIFKIKSDIQNLKSLGFYELLIKEIGSVLFEKDIDKMFRPSRLYMDDEFRIYLTDFDNMEIAMTPLPKSLFILFLRYPEGINLKSLIDYRKELLEIYKLLSYRETYFNLVESINRICNPIESSINEKLSRIKEAFLRKISMDTARYYIVAGERGMEKRIEIDRSLIELPKVFEEIELTKASE